MSQKTSDNSNVIAAIKKANRKTTFALKDKSGLFRGRGEVI